MRIHWPDITVTLHVVGRYNWSHTHQLQWAGGVYDHLLWVVESGAGHLVSANGRQAVSAGQCVWYRPGVGFDFRQARGPMIMYGLVFALTDRAGRTVAFDQYLPDEVLAEPQPGFALAVAQRVHALAGGVQDVGRNTFMGGTRLTAEHLVTGLLMELDRHNDVATAAASSGVAPVHCALFHLARAIADDPATAPTPAQQAAQLGITATHLCRLYRRLFHRSPSGFIIQFRIRHAQRLLTETQDSIAQVAEQVGYASQGFFSRQFLQMVGMSPLAFRRQVHNDAAAST